MRLTYIFHSGFSIETEKAIILFDYWMDPACVMPSLLQQEKPLYVLASHFHEDHFNRAVLAWKRQKANIVYIFSKDILRHRRARKDEADVWLAKGGEWTDGIINVKATGSTDSGVSWNVETAGMRIFHAGDLNNWYARFLAEENGGLTVYSEEMDEEVNPVEEEKRYLGELKDIRKIAESFDVVLFPVDGRIGNGYTRGARQFIERFSVRLFVPMHFVASGFESAWRFREFTEPRGIPFWAISREGESMEINL